MNDPRTIAIFDFDGTLTKGDSFWPFLGYATGWPRTFAALLEGVFLLAMAGPEARKDPYTFLKSHLLRKLLKGQEPEKLASAIEKLRHKTKWNEMMCQTLRDHHAAGHHIVVASGGLDLYLPKLMEGLPYHALICTEAGTEGGIVTGAMPVGNCVRQRKAELLTGYLNNKEPFAKSWGYGNYPQDLPMMALVKFRVIV